MTLSSALEFTSYLSKERHYVPWSIGETLILRTRKFFQDTHLKKCFDVSIKFFFEERKFIRFPITTKTADGFFLDSIPIVLNT